MSKSDDTVSVNLGCWPVLLLFSVFLTLKLAGAVDWSWWIITAPIWAFPAAMLLFVGAIFAVVAVIMILALPVAIYQGLRK